MVGMVDENGWLYRSKSNGLLWLDPAPPRNRPDDIFRTAGFGGHGVDRAHSQLGLPNPATSRWEKTLPNRLHALAPGSRRVGCGVQKSTIVSELIRSRANMEIRNEGGDTPLLKACGSGLTDVAKLLIEYRANIHETDDKRQGILQKARCST